MASLNPEPRITIVESRIIESRCDDALVGDSLVKDSGKRIQGTGNREQGTGNREQGIVVHGSVEGAGKSMTIDISLQPDS